MNVCYIYDSRNYQVLIDNVEPFCDAALAIYDSRNYQVLIDTKSGTNFNITSTIVEIIKSL